MLRFLLAAILFTSVSPPASAQPKGRKVAFLVGVGSFKHDLPDLNGSPQKDVTELAKVLRDGGFDVVLLTDAEATREQVEKRFRAVLEGEGNKDKALGKGDLLLACFCTHGFTLPGPSKKDEPFLAAHDSKGTRTDTLVRLNGLIEEGRDSGATILYLIDACREIVDPNRGAVRGIQGAQVVLPKGTAVLFSCGRGQFSHQNEKAGGHGLFTYAVLRSLRGDAGVRDTLSWNGLVTDVEQAFRSAEFLALIPPEKPQTPFEARGELAYTEILSADPVGKDLRAYNAARNRGALKRAEFLRDGAAKRLTGWKAAADAGHAAGQVLYGHCLLEGIGVGKDAAAAVGWFRKAADAGSAHGLYILGWCHAIGIGVPQDEAKAIELYRRAAPGEPRALFQIGQVYARKGGPLHDPAAAIDWFRKAAAAREPAGLAALGRAYADGDGVPKDEAEALKWLRMAAAAGDSHALGELGDLYREGRGVPKDEATAADYYQKAADAGNSCSLGQLAVLYAEGRGVPKDEARAVALARRAAEADDPCGMAKLGYFYWAGVGIPRDDAKAAEWTRKAADAGDPMGMNNLGWMYETGRGGLPQSRAEAVMWYKKAAAAGHEKAKENLKRLGVS